MTSDGAMTRLEQRLARSGPRERAGRRARRAPEGAAGGRRPILRARSSAEARPRVEAKIGVSGGEIGLRMK